MYIKSGDKIFRAAALYTKTNQFAKFGKMIPNTNYLKHYIERKKISRGITFTYK